MTLNKDFLGKTAVVTGAASGIGRAVTEMLYKNGANIMLIDRNKLLLEEFVKQIGDDKRVSFQVANIADEAQVQQFINTTISLFTKIDILINNAGIASKRFTAPEQELSDWHKVLDVNLLGTVLTTKYASKEMITQHYGAIVNTASIAGIRSGAGGNAYSASKAATISFTQTSACDLGKYNIRVNAVCPGLIETGMTKIFFDKARDKGVTNRLGERCELLRSGRPEEVAEAILFLASDRASYITGQALAIDGGNTASLNMPGMKV
ncbi:SDR family NAD(P)-dependent oxidoreductase [Colwellia sp. E150_009]